MANFPADFDLRTPVLPTDKILIDNITTGVTEYTTVQKLLDLINFNGTKYWSCAGLHFDANQPDTEDITKGFDGTVTANGDGIMILAHVNLPHGATVTSAIVYGNGTAEAESWVLRRVKLSDLTTFNLGGANINTADVTITLGVIDNSLYGYYIYTSTLDTGDIINGARITYTI